MALLFYNKTNIDKHPSFFLFIYFNTIVKLVSKNVKTFNNFRRLKNIMLYILSEDWGLDKVTLLLLHILKTYFLSSNSALSNNYS